MSRNHVVTVVEVPPRRRIVENLILLTVGFCVVLIYARPWRPIWLDELFHFALGGMSWQYALRTIDYTTIEVSFGQTGIYMLIDWWLLQIFGANSVALRLPSAASAALLLFSAVVFLRKRDFGFVWQVIVLCAFATHASLMFFTGEARPYLPLAAATLGVLAYYQWSLPERRNIAPRLLGFGSFWFASVIHPYAAYVLPAVVVFSTWLAVRDGRIEKRLGAALHFANPALVILGAVLYLVVGQLTWMRKVLDLGYEPLSTMGNSVVALLQNLAWAHIPSGKSVLFLALMATLVTVAVLVSPRPVSRNALVPPIVLLSLAVLSSIVISVLSAYRGYYILERQWVAGMALGVLAIVWFFAEASRSTRQRGKLIGGAPSIVFIVMTVVLALEQSSVIFNQNVQDRKEQSQYRAESGLPDDLRPERIDDTEKVLYAANVNIARGGDVWPIFVDWYDTQSGMRPEFREVNPSWSGFLAEAGKYAP